MHASHSFGVTLRGLWSRLVMLASIAVVLAHAVAPVHAPMERIKGSAFSAATVDVSVLTATVAVTKAAPLRLLPVVLLLAGAMMLVLIAPVRRSVSPVQVANPRAPPDRALLTAISPIGPPAR